MEVNKAAIIIGINFLKNELLDTSSSSSDDEIYNIVKDKQTCHRIKNFIEDTVEYYSGNEFKKNFRIEKESANYLIAQYEQSQYYTERIYKGGRTQTSPKNQMLSFLWFCSNKNSIREICNLFGITDSTFHRNFNRIINFLTEEVAPNIIKFPNDDSSKQAIANEFQKISGFPNVLGCIDGSYIYIRSPKHKIKSTYANRHDLCSITLQAICDTNLRFLDVFTGVPSKIHDARVYKLSFISKEIPIICGSKYHLLGDAAYPLREFLLTPYRNYGRLQECERKFNVKFCQTRVKIENTFGMLKCRFRQLMRLDFLKVQTAAKFIVSCCVIHNICIDKNDFWEVVDGDSENNDNDIEQQIYREERSEVLLRNCSILDDSIEPEIQISSKKIVNRCVASSSPSTSSSAEDENIPPAEKKNKKKKSLQETIWEIHVLKEAARDRRHMEKIEKSEKIEQLLNKLIDKTNQAT